METGESRTPTDNQNDYDEECVWRTLFASWSSDRARVIRCRKKSHPGAMDTSTNWRYRYYNRAGWPDRAGLTTGGDDRPGRRHTTNDDERQEVCALRTDPFCSRFRSAKIRESCRARTNDISSSQCPPERSFSTRFL